MTTAVDRELFHRGCDGGTLASSRFEESSLLARRYIELILGHRAAVLAGCVAITLLAAWSLSHGVFASSLIKLFFGNSAKYQEYRQLANRFGDADLMVIAYEDDTLFTVEGWHRLERITEDLDDFDFIRRVESVTNAAHVRGTDGGIEVRTYAEMVASGAPLAELKSTLLGEDLLSGTLISADGCCVAVMLEFTDDENRPIEAIPEMLEQLYGVFVREGISRDRLQPAGMVPESVAATQQSVYSIKVIFPVTVAILVLLVYLLFHRLWPVFITTGVALISLIWTFGFAILLDRQINIMMAMVPAVIVVVAFSDIIHLCSSYLIELRAGLSRREAIVKSGSEVGEACFFTSMTTLVGFVALAFVPTPVFRLAGTVLGVGVAVALLLAMTLVPVLFSAMPVPDVRRRENALATRLIGWLTESCHAMATRRPVLIAGAFLAVGVAAGIGAWRIEVETSMIDRLDEDNPVVAARRFVLEHFDGTNFLDVYLTAKNGDVLDPKFFAGLERLQSDVAAFDDVDSVQSVVDLVALLHRELARRDEGETKSRALLAQYLLLFEMSGGEGLERIIDDERQTVRMTVRLPGTGLVRTHEIGERVREGAQALLGPAVEVFPGGLAALFGEWIQFVIAGQRRGLLFAFVATTLMMIFSLRAITAGLIAMIPNILPLFVLGGYIGWAWDKVDSDTMLIGMIAIGIAVDDTVHFMTRFRLEAAKTADADIALRETFRFTGAAIVMTTVILVGGFLPFVTSDYFTTKIMGSLLPMTLAVALAADLLLLPALVKLGILRLPMARPAPTAGSTSGVDTVAN